MNIIFYKLAIFTGINFTRYLIIAGTFYLIFWIIFRKKMKTRRIQLIPDDTRQIMREFFYSLLTSFIFAVVTYLILYWPRGGSAILYFRISEFGLPYFFTTIAIMILLQDTLFYWSHRLMHLPQLYKLLHAVHHSSKNPTPWAAYCFHPGEAILQVLGGTIVLWLMPVHPLALGIFTNISLVLNCIGHLGYEFYPSGFTKGKYSWWINSPVHHNMHHQYINANYGLFFNWWDKLLNTNHPQYHEIFEEVVARRKKII